MTKYSAMPSNTQDTPIFLWATPRSVSTAFERVMKNSQCLSVCHEPFTEVYYYGPDRTSNRYGNLPPDKRAARYSRDEVNKRLFGEISNGRVFIKDLAFQAEPYVSEQLLRKAVNIFITSHPHRVYASLLKVKPDFTEDEFGFVALKRIFDRVQAFQKNTMVIDGVGFRNSPEKTVIRVCDFLRIPYSPALLQWDDGSIRKWSSEEKESQAKFHSTLEKSKTILPAGEAAVPMIRDEHLTILSRAEAIYQELSRYWEGR